MAQPSELGAKDKSGKTVSTAATAYFLMGDPTDVGGREFEYAAKVAGSAEKSQYIRKEMLPLIRDLLRTSVHPELLTHASPTEALDVSCCRFWSSR